MNDHLINLSNDPCPLAYPLLIEEAPTKPPPKRQMSELFQLCRANKWDTVLHRVKADPRVGTQEMQMDNHISTTILHQAVTSKGDVAKRAAVIECILEQTPCAAGIKNGYGSFPLHVIAQRNTRIKSKVKEVLILKLIDADEKVLLEEGGTGKRTPLHIIFTDYVAPGLVKLMIERGSQACFMKDKKGWLPAHVACSRHCSPDKLRMLLEVNPDALHERTLEGKTLLDLARSTATKSHPNFALIDELGQQLGRNPTPCVKSAPAHAVQLESSPSRGIDTDASAKAGLSTYRHNIGQEGFRSPNLEPIQEMVQHHYDEPASFENAQGHYPYEYGGQNSAPTAISPFKSPSEGFAKHANYGEVHHWSSHTTEVNYGQTWDGAFNDGGGNFPQAVTPAPNSRKRKHPDDSDIMADESGVYALLMLSQKHDPSQVFRNRVRLSSSESTAASTEVPSQASDQEDAPPTAEGRMQPVLYADGAIGIVEL